MSLLAQEESRSISENCTWNQRKRFADGKVSVSFQRFLGYDRSPDGNLVVNREQVVIVNRIYSLFLQGMTYHSIADILTKDGIPTSFGKRNGASPPSRVSSTTRSTKAMRSFRKPTPSIS